MFARSLSVFVAATVCAFAVAQVNYRGGGRGPVSRPPVRGGGHYCPNHILVKFSSYGNFRGNMNPILVRSKLLSYNKSIGWYTYQLPSNISVTKAQESLQGLQGVAACEPDYIQSAQFTPTDPAWPQQYGPVLMNMQNAWNYSLGLQSEIIAVVDTGVDLGHPEFVGRLDTISGANIISPNSPPDDNEGHGTHVAGIIAAGVDNGIGIAGICPDAQIMPVKVLDSNGNGYSSDIANGITFAANNHANVINMSLGGPNFTQDEQDAINYATQMGVICVAAAGNQGANEIYYPANDLGIISVAASDANDNLASYSNFGPWVTVVAPGDNIFSTYLYSGYKVLSGTSMSSAMVSGVMGILQSYAPQGTPISTLENALVAGCDSIRTNTGGGRVDAYNSILLLQNAGNSSNTVTPYSAITELGTYEYGDFSSLFSIDANAYTVQTAQMPNLDQQATIWANYTLVQTPGNIKSLSATICAYGFQNAINRLYAYDYIHRRYTQIGTWTMAQTSNQGYTVNFPSNFRNYIWNGSVSLAINGDIPYNSYPGTPPTFNFSVDQAILNVGQ